MNALDTEPVVLSQEYLRNPYPLYRWMRENAPVCLVQIPDIGVTAYLVTRYDDVRAALAHPNISKDGGALDSEPFTHHMLNYDPPTHTRLRAVVRRTFQRGRIETMRPAITLRAKQMIDSLSDQIDVVDDYAYPFTMGVLRELLGVAEAEDEDFRELADVLLREVTSDRRADSAAKMTEYLTRLVQAKRGFPGEDVLTQLLAACDSEGVISEEEVLSTVFLLLVAGHETTINLIGNGVWALLKHPDQLAMLAADPELIGGAVDEILRWAGPAGVTTLRHTTGPVSLDGNTIPEQAFVLLAVESAGRDDSRYQDPERFDITRRAGHGMAFGHGVHHCLGASLAKLEGEVAIGQLIARFPGLTCLGDLAELRWRPNIIIRGLDRMPVQLAT